MPPLETEDIEQVKTLVAEAIKEAIPTLVEAAKEEANSVADGRINKLDLEKAVTKVMEKVGKGTGKTDDEEKSKDTSNGLSERDRAFLRRSLKQAVKDEAAELPEGIRSHVRDMALAAADRVGLELDSDEDRIAKELVEAFKVSMEKAKGSIEDGLRTDLKARKLLLDDDKGGQGASGGDGGSGDEKDPKKLYEKGAERAKERFGEKKE